MLPLEALVRGARALADPLADPASGAAGRADAPAAATPEGEVARVLQICNACRYCEGFCAVFPAMTRRLEFPAVDAHFLANLCHHCGACLHACQYAPPHEFGVNVPRAMAAVRLETYTRFAWPRAFGAAYRANGLVLALALAAGLSLFLALAVAAGRPLWGVVEGSFYGIFPHHLLVAMFAPVFAFALLALAVGVVRFWRETPSAPASSAALGEAAHDALTLKYLGGGHGEGCSNEDDASTLARRRLHHLVFYGFMACFAATSVATLYHYALGWPAPYPMTSLPKLLGTAGGIALVIGTVGLLRLNLRRHPLHHDPRSKPMDRGFIALLLLTAASGLVLMLVKTTAALPIALCVHLGSVMALFAMLPYGKFAHGVYRSAALLKWAIEKRQPSRLQLGSE